jgi:adenine-specific DNA-methyltransferase
MKKMKMETENQANKNIFKLAKLFPACVTEAIDAQGRLLHTVNFEKLKQILGIDIAQDDEVYEFTWVGKKSALVEANRQIRKTLRPCKEKSNNWDETENIYIEGDNLETLKLLQESYLGSIKMIYIDPPYNTGNDFVYRDDFRMSTDEYDVESGLFDDENNRLFINNDSNGRFHSDWCSMIYSRLIMARNLLSESGVIYISIDDGEVGNLRKICDEIFGESNFLANLIWEKKYTVANDALFFSDNHDHILCYAKSTSKFEIGQLSRTEEMNAAYKNPDNHPKGPWKATPLHARSGSANSANFSYKFKNGVIFTPPSGTFSRYSANTLKQYDEADEIWFGKDGTAVPSRKTFLCDLKKSGIVPRTIIPFSVGGHNHEAVEEVKELLGKNVFTSPKPVKLLRYLMTVANLGENDIVLDFFSGSGTTAQALMELNIEEGKKCKYILIQLKEKCEDRPETSKHGYSNICEIGEERIRKAGDMLQENNPSVNFDYGFRVFSLDESNMKDVYYAAEDYNQGILDVLESNIKEDRTDLDLLFGCLIEWGLPLSMPYTSETMEGCTVHTYNEGDLVACFNDNIPDNVIKEIAKRQPLRVVFRDSSFSGSPAKINVSEIFKLLAPDTSVKVI